jgi:hypothetical protein
MPALLSVPAHRTASLLARLYRRGRADRWSAMFGLIAGRGLGGSPRGS